MKIIVHDFCGHPFQVQLSRALSQRGHTVVHLYSNEYVGGKGNLSTTDLDPDSLSIRSVSIGRSINRYNFLARLKDEIDYGKALSKEIKEEQPDIVLSANTPLDAQKAIHKLCKMQDIKFVFWLQDVIGLATKSILSQKIPIIGNLIGIYYQQMENRLLRNSDLVIPISADFRALLNDVGVSSNKVLVVENWAPLNEMPQHERQNAWSKEHNLETHQVVLYSGALGLKHNPALLLHLADSLTHTHPNAKVVVISEGIGAEWLNKKIEEHTVSTISMTQDMPDHPRIMELIKYFEEKTGLINRKKLQALDGKNN